MVYEGIYALDIMPSYTAPATTSHILRLTRLVTNYAHPSVPCF